MPVGQFGSLNFANLVTCGYSYSQLHCSVLENALKCPVFCPKENLVFFEGNSIFLRRKIIFLSDKILALPKGDGIGS